MRAIDIHAHLTPQCFQREVLAGRTRKKSSGKTSKGYWASNGSFDLQDWSFRSSAN
jgi:hypothetical protein